jgi:hypothetical protein
LLARRKEADERRPGTVRRDDLLSYRTVDLRLEAQLLDVHQQMVEYERSKEPETGGRWSKVCGGCGYVNHERYHRCEGCGEPLGDRYATECQCPVCSAPVEKSARECAECGSRFWSPILTHQREPIDGAGPRPQGGGEGGGGT